MFPNRELFKHCLWTAHGFKQLPLHFDLSWKNGADGESMAALPNIDELFIDVFLGNLTLDLNLYPTHSMMSRLLLSVMCGGFRLN